MARQIEEDVSHAACLLYALGSVVYLDVILLGIENFKCLRMISATDTMGSKVKPYTQNTVVKIDSSPLVRFYQYLNGLVKVYVYLPRKSAKHSDNIN